MRITHLPTNIVVTCQNERSQGRNRDMAMRVLRARLYQRALDERRAEEEKRVGEKKSIEWGSQIRSYVLHPYRMVKDHRTGQETGDTDSVLDGAITPFRRGVPEVDGGGKPGACLLRRPRRASPGWPRSRRGSRSASPSRSSPRRGNGGRRCSCPSSSATARSGSC